MMGRQRVKLAFHGTWMAPVCLCVHNASLFTLIVILHTAPFSIRFMHSYAVIRSVSESGFLARVSGTSVWSSLRVD